MHEKIWVKLFNKLCLFVFVTSLDIIFCNAAELQF